MEYSNHVWQCDHTLVDVLLVDNYNQRIDARMGDQTRFQRWEAGLLAAPDLMSDRELDICLMKQTNRSIYRDGYIRFENLMYRGEYLAGYAGRGDAGTRRIFTRQSDCGGLLGCFIDIRAATFSGSSCYVVSPQKSELLLRWFVHKRSL